MRLFGRSFAKPAAALVSARAARSAHAAQPVRGCGVEGLEKRVLFHLELISELPNTAVAPGTATSEIALTPHIDNEEINGTIVRMQTAVGDVLIELTDAATPATVANFLAYVNSNRYDGTFIHRAIPGFVVQGGGYLPNRSHIQTDPPVVNEFSPTRSNVRGTIAMAKAGGDPNSATSEWFFNLEDTNAANLDNQNGGFTTFGRVIAGTMSTVDTIAGLPITDEDTSTPFNLYNDLPTLTEVPDDTVPATSPASNLVILNDVSAIPETAIYSYTVTSTNPALVTGAVNNGVLQLSYGAGLTGTAEVTVTATDGTTTVTDTFSAGVGVLDVLVGTGGAKAVTFTDADGTVANVTLKGGAGTLRFQGVNLSQTNSKAGATVAGTITDVGIVLTGTGTSGALAVKAGGGDGLINVNSLTSDGGMRSIAGKQVNITGDVTIAGNVGKADFFDVTNSVMTFGGAGGGLALSLNNANAVDIVSQIPIRSLKAESFAGGGPDVGVITAPALGSRTVNGDFGQRLNLAGPLGNVKVGGAASTFLPWSVGGGAGKVAVGSTADGFVADFNGGLASLTVNGALTGDIAASTIRSLVVKGDMNNANVTVTGPGAALGKATVSGTILFSRIQATNGIGSVTAGAINGSTIYAGLTTDGGVLPTTQADLNPGASSIKSVTVRGSGGAPTFVNSNIAARTVGKLNLGVIQVGNGAVPFGVAGDTIASISGTGTSGIRLSRLSEPSQSTTQEDFTVNVL